MARKAISKKLRFTVFERDRFRCQYCGGAAPDVALHADHVIPVKSGGTNSFANLVTSCADCNQGKQARLMDGDDGRSLGCRAVAHEIALFLEHTVPTPDESPQLAITAATIERLMMYDDRVQDMEDVHHFLRMCELLVVKNWNHRETTRQAIDGDDDVPDWCKTDGGFIYFTFKCMADMKGVPAP